MPVPEPNLYPDFNTIRLSHVCLNVKDLAVSRRFYTEILGFQITGESNSHIYLRAMEERGHHCVILQKSQTPGTVEVLGFKTFDEADLDRAEAYFKAKGRPTSWVERPYQGKTLLTADNMGIPLEFYHKMDRLAPIHQKYALYRGVKPLRIDHFNCFSHDVDASVAFYSDFGFRVTEYTEDDDSKKLWAAWMHRKGGVHDMAFTNGTGPRMHHVAFWVPTPLNIIDLLDLMATTGHVSNIERGPGRHGISNAFFFISSILMATGLRFIARIIKRLIPTWSRSNGTCKTRSARRYGGLRPRKAGSNMAPALSGSTPRHLTSRPARSLRHDTAISDRGGRS